MLKFKWTCLTITTAKAARQMVEQFNRLQPEIGGFDTEDTGLHIILDKPFLFQFGYLDIPNKHGYTYAVDLERQPIFARQVISAWQELAKTLKIYFAHNVKFDLSMMINLGLPYTGTNISDTYFYIRYATDAIAVKNGGAPLGLKEFAARFIEGSAKRHEQMLDQEKSVIVSKLREQLKQRLQGHRPPEKYGFKSYTTKALETIFKDPIFEPSDLPADVRQIYYEWLQQDVPLYMQKKINGLPEVDMVRYDTLNRENLTKYAHFDIVYMLEIYLLLNPVLIARHNERGVEIENSLIYPLVEMERNGFKVNKQYLEECKIKVKKYIIERRKRFYELAGRELKIGQHEAVKKIIQEKYGIQIITTNAAELDIVLSNLIRTHANPEVIEFINILQELRTLEKWYSTYILRFLKNLHDTDRLYTMINQVGTISGRVTSDFQQFPKKPIKTVTGEELFHPRKMVIISGDDYNGLVFLDFSQIELRFQAFYTILVGHPDLNLCRAYMPYQCHLADGTEYNYKNIEHVKNWQDQWYYDEDPERLWEPTDVHGATTEKATGLKPGTPEFKAARSAIGKKVNFSKNYGASRKRMRIMFPEATEDEVTRIDKSYYEAFPGVKFYHQYCYDRALASSWTENLYGIRYYNTSGHKLINLLVQGSAAYYLKTKIRELYDYSKEHNVKTRWQMQIHDELMWERHKDDLDVFFDFKRIMEDWPDTFVPIVAEMDASNASWADKKGVHNLEELQVCLST
jgi:DNA polymerase-1